MYKRQVNESHKYRAVLGAEMYNYSQAQEAGLIDDVVEVDNLMTTAKDKAKDLATMGHPSYSMTKELFIAEPMAKINEAIKEHQKES